MTLEAINQVARQLTVVALTPVETPYGTLFVDPEELVIGRLLQADGKIPDISTEIAFLAPFIHSGDTVMDVGANYGLFTLALAGLVGEGGDVEAVEPNGEMYAFWDKTCQDHALPQVEWTIAALGTHLGWGELRLDPRGSGGTQVVVVPSFDTSDVPITTLDELSASIHPVRAIKIDAEGRDVDILLGGWKILRDDRPAVILEWNPEAMESLGKTPLVELARLLELAHDVRYHLVDLNGTPNPDPLRGNVGFLPVEV